MDIQPKKRIGTVEGVALILSVLACLILFFKIMPNMNANLEFYNEKVQEFERQISKLQVAVENMQRVSVRGSNDVQVRQLEEMTANLQTMQTALPEQYRDRITKTNDELAQLLNDLRK
jgi:hypothetical protein